MVHLIGMSGQSGDRAKPRGTMRILPTATAIVTALVLAGCGSDDGAADTPKAAELCATYCGDFTTLERQTCIGAVMN